MLCYIFVPDDLENWTLLVSAIHGEAVLTTSANRRQALLEDELRLLQYILSQGQARFCAFL